MKPNFMNYLGRLAGAAFILAILAWAGPAWGQNYTQQSLTIDSYYPLNGGTLSMTNNGGQVYIISGGHLEAVNNSLIKLDLNYYRGGGLFIVNGNLPSNNFQPGPFPALLTASDSRIEVQGPISIANGQLNATNSYISCTDLTIGSGGKLTASNSEIAGPLNYQPGNTYGRIEIKNGGLLTASNNSKLYVYAISSGGQLNVSDSELSLQYAEYGGKITANNTKITGGVISSDLTMEAGSTLVDSGGFVGGYSRAGSLYDPPPQVVRLDNSSIFSGNGSGFVNNGYNNNSRPGSRITMTNSRILTGTKDPNLTGPCQDRDFQSSYYMCDFRLNGVELSAAGSEISPPPVSESPTASLRRRRGAS